MNYEVIIDSEKCVGCGLCVKDCVASDIYLENKKAHLKNIGCIKCGHCEAICPNNAVKINGFEDDVEEYSEQTRLNPDELLKAIKTRRTIRNFKADTIPDEIVDKIIEAGRLCPTGGNSQSTSYIILGSKQEELEKIAVSMFRNLSKLAKPFVKFIRNMNIDDNFFFKKAPLVIVVTGNDVNASLAAENMTFMAEAYGLGVLYSGFYTTCVNNNRKLRKLMGMKKKNAVTTMVIGYPNVKYYRTVRRKKANVNKL